MAGYKWQEIIFFILVYFNGYAITPDEILSIKEVTDPQISPDGREVAFTINWFSAPEDSASIRQSDLWIVTSDGHEPAVELIGGPGDQYMPRWSPDGRFLAYLSDTDGQGAGLFLHDLHQQTSSGPIVFGTGIREYQWFPDAQSIAFLATDTSWKNIRDPGSGNETDTPGYKTTFTQLFCLRIEDYSIEPITRGPFQVNSFDIAPDGEKIALCISGSDAPDVVLYHAELAVTSTKRSNLNILAPIAGDLIMSINLGNIRWSPDSQEILYFERFGNAYTMLPALIKHDGTQKRILCKSYPGTIWEMDWLPGSSLILASFQEGVQGMLGIFDPHNEHLLPLVETGFAWSWPDNWSIEPAGSRIVYKNASYKNPDDIRVMDSDGSGNRRLTDMNPRAGKFTFGKEETISWMSYDGMSIQGVLIKPSDIGLKKPWPLVTIVHGGPEWAWWSGWQASWHEWGQLLASHGFAVLLPNPRGSNGYGWEFVEANLNDWGGGDFQDIMSGIDDLIQKGIADPNRLGIGGWSYGGYMSAWAITQTNRFRAAVVGAGFADLTGFYVTTPFPSVFDAYFGGNPDERPELYTRCSPMTHIKDAMTPTLILHGENDSGVPGSQAQQLYNALRSIRTDARLMIYPGEGHMIKQYGHQKDIMNRILAWYSDQLLSD